jgi:2-methylcitrate dehydratase PrpD
MAVNKTALVLAQHIRDIKVGPTHASSQESVLRCVLDILCAAAAAQDDKGVRAVQQSARHIYGDGHSDIWFSGRKSNAYGAVLANSTAAAALDLDDGYRKARGHPGAAVIPAAWSMLEALPSGVDKCEAFCSAVAAGYEAGVRMSIGRASYAPSGAWSAYAAIGAVGNLCKVSSTVIANAFGIAAQFSPALPGLAGLMGSDVKEGIAWGTVTGLSALKMAQSGFTGPVAIFDEVETFVPDKMLDGIGSALLIEGTYFKPYACCRHIHAPLDASAALLVASGVDIDQVQSMVVHTYLASFNLSNLAEPRTLIEAQYSIPFCVALSVLRGANALLPMRVESLGDVAVKRFARLISVRHDTELDGLFPERSPARVSITLRDGQTLVSPITDPRGDPHTALSYRELESKFTVATASLLDAERQTDVLHAVQGLRDGDIDTLRRAIE